MLAETILKFYDMYNAMSKEDLIYSVKSALELQDPPIHKLHGIAKIVGKGVSTVNNWWGGSRIPVAFIPIIAEGLGVNVFALVSGRPSPYGLRAETEAFNTQYGEDITKRIADVFRAYQGVSKRVIIDNLGKHWGDSETLRLGRNSSRMDDIMRLCDCKKDAYHAWFSLSRERIKIPLDCLCKVSIFIQIDIDYLLEEHEDGA